MNGITVEHPPSSDPRYHDEETSQPRTPLATRDTDEVFRTRRDGSVKSDDGSLLCIKNKSFSRESFYAQALLIYIICLACIINLSVGSEHTSVWISLLSASLGYILPSPKIRGSERRTVVGVTREI